MLSSPGVSGATQQTIKDQRSHQHKNHPQRQLHMHMTIINQQGKNCEENHRIFKCAKFKRLGFNELVQLFNVKGLGFNCLQPGHRSENCDGFLRRQSERKHHKLL